MHIRNWMLGAALWVVASAASAVSDSYQIVKSVDHDGSATFEVVSPARSRELVAQNALEGRLFVQAMAQAKQAWKQDTTGGGAPFPNIRLVPRKVTLAGPALPSMEKILEQKADLEKAEKEGWLKLTEGLAPLTDGQEAALALFAGAIREGREKERLASVAKGTSPGSGGGDWVEPMRKLNAGFDGKFDYVAQFGDSITYSAGFWKFVSWSKPNEYLPEDGMPRDAGGCRWRDMVGGAGDEGKGAAEGNYSAWRSAQLLEAVPGVLTNRRPEVAIIMIGSNDARHNELAADYETNLCQIVQLCLDAHCIPILTTIPPQRGCHQSVPQANAIVEAVAARYRVPLVDYYGAIMRYAPEGKWDGTLIGEDGVHPTSGQNHVLTPENFAKSGFAVRNYVTFLKFREVYFMVMHPDLIGERRR